MRLRKLISTVFAATLLLGAVGCKRENNPRPSNYTIREDDPWYLATSFDPFKMVDYDGNYHDSRKTIDIVGDNLLVEIEKEVWDDERKESSFCYELGLLTMGGSIFCQNSVSIPRNDFDYMYPAGAYVNDGKYYLRFVNSIRDGLPHILYSVEWDTKNNTVGEITPHNLDIEPGKNIYDWIYYDSYVLFGYNDSETNSCGIIIMDKDEIIGDILLSEYDIQDLQLWQAFIKDGSLICEGYYYRESDYYLFDYIFRLTYDLEAKTYTIHDVDDSTMDSTVEGYDGSYYEAHSDGIYVDGELYMSYVDCESNIDMNNLKYPYVLSVSEDRITIMGYLYDRAGNYDSEIVIKFDRLPVNPNAGKMVINALSPVELAPDIMEGIRKYNSGDNEYFIRYRVEDIEGVATEDLPSYMSSISAEIMSDSGPDIIFNADSIPGIMDSDHLMDLSSDIKLDPDRYYTNISDLCKVDGKEYMIPLSFSPVGFLMDREDLGEDKTGFTYEEYMTFVARKCDNTDPLFSITNFRMYEEMLCNFTDFDYMSDGKADFDCEGFREYLDYFNEFRYHYDSMIPEYVIYSINSDEGEMVTMHSLVDLSPVSVLYRSDFNRCAMLINKYDEPVLSGLPSLDGCGPRFTVESSVSVCSLTGVKKGCLDFIGTLMKPEVMIATTYYSLDRNVEKILISSSYKKELYQYHKDISEFYKQAAGKDYEVEDSRLKLHDSVIGSLSAAYMSDAYIEDVVFEETVYFVAGESDADKTIKNINDRVQSYLDLW